MKNTKISKLSLNRETLVRLNKEDLSRVGGGKADPPPVYLYPTTHYWICELSIVPECRR